MWAVTVGKNFFSVTCRGKLKYLEFFFDAVIALNLSCVIDVLFTDYVPWVIKITLDSQKCTVMSSNDQLQMPKLNSNSNHRREQWQVK